jgi:hypothetical protein
LPAISLRPEEWLKWALKSRHGVRRYDSIPLIADSAELGIAIVKWWHAMQPDFRKSDKDMPSPTYVASDGSLWDPLRKGGPNGFVSIMTLVVWWGRALADRPFYEEDSTARWREMIVDMTQCLLAIISTTTVAQKRKATAGKENDPKR